MHYLEKQLHQTANHLAWQFDQFAAEYDLTGQQLSTIDFLANQPDWQSTQHAIEVEFNIKRSTTTKMLQRMEKAGIRDITLRLFADARHDLLHEKAGPEAVQILVDWIKRV